LKSKLLITILIALSVVLGATAQTDNESLGEGLAVDQTTATAVAREYDYIINSSLPPDMVELAPEEEIDREDFFQRHCRVQQSFHRHSCWCG